MSVLPDWVQLEGISAQPESKQGKPIGFPQAESHNLLRVMQDSNLLVQEC